MNISGTIYWFRVAVKAIPADVGSNDMCNPSSTWDAVVAPHFLALPPNGGCRRVSVLLHHPSKPPRVAAQTACRISVPAISGVNSSRQSASRGITPSLARSG
jgi:hypothetical protein